MHHIPEAGKTGTAQVVYYGPQKDKYGTNTLNLVHVGFAPFENPEVAYAVMIPWATTNFEQYRSQANHIAREILDVYFDLQKKYADEGVSTSSVQQTMISPTTEKKLNEDEAVETINE